MPAIQQYQPVNVSLKIYWNKFPGQRIGGPISCIERRKSTIRRLKYYFKFRKAYIGKDGLLKNLFFFCRSPKNADKNGYLYREYWLGLTRSDFRGAKIPRKPGFSVPFATTGGQACSADLIQVPLTTLYRASPGPRFPR